MWSPSKENTKALFFFLKNTQFHCYRLGITCCLLRSASCFVCSIPTHVANKEVAELPLVDKLYTMKSMTQLKGVSALLFFIFIKEMLYKNDKYIKMIIYK